MTDPCGGDGGGDDVGGGVDVSSSAGVLRASTAGSAVGTTGVTGDFKVHGDARIFLLLSLLLHLLLHLLLLLLLTAAGRPRENCLEVCVVSLHVSGYSN